MWEGVVELADGSVKYRNKASFGLPGGRLAHHMSLSSVVSDHICHLFLLHLRRPPLIVVPSHGYKRKRKDILG